jgi:ankyrin repeat protein
LKKVKELIEEKQFDPLQKERQVGANVLHYSARYGQLVVLRYFIEERGCNPASQDNRAWTPLHYAAVGKHLDIVHYLVAEQQMDPLCCADDGTTPLHAACQGGDINIVRYLVNELSKFLPLKDIVTSRGFEGKAPIHLAALRGHLATVDFLVTVLNCDPNITQPIPGCPHSIYKEG